LIELLPGQGIEFQSRFERFGSELLIHDHRLECGAQGSNPIGRNGAWREQRAGRPNR
jgi:hypothetical protein